MISTQTQPSVCDSIKNSHPINPNRPFTMQASFTLSRLIAIPLLLIIIGISAVLFSVLFAVLLIPVAIIGFKFWRALRRAEKANTASIIEAEYVVLEKNDDKL